MWEPTLDVTIEHDDCDDRHVEITVKAPGVAPDDVDDDEWERQLPRVKAMRRYMAGVLARLTLVLSEPVAVTAIAHGCGRVPARSGSVSWGEEPTVHDALPGKVLQYYRDELDTSGLGRELVRGRAIGARWVRPTWPGDYECCHVTGSSLATPTVHRDRTEGPELWLVVPNWQGGRDAKWWIEQVGQVLDEIRADS